MNELELLDAVGGIDEKFVAEASAEKRSAGRRLVRWGALAACLCVVAAGAIYAIPRINSHNLPADVPVPAADGDVKPAPSTAPASIPGGASNENESDGRGVYIPAIELPSSVPEGTQMDMIGLIVYRGGIYTQAANYMGDDARAVEGLVGEYLGTCDGSIDEWSTREEYERDFAGNIPGDFYAVSGYDPDFRICIRQEFTGENGEPDLYIQFLDRLNGIALETGEDLFESRLRIPGRIESIEWQTHDDWNWNRGNFHAADLGPGVWESFLDEVCAGEFVYTWDPDRDFYEGMARSSIYDTPNQAHLTLAMEDGTSVDLRLIEGGYVGYQPLGWYFVKIPGEAFDAVYDACGGTHETGWTLKGK